jgi:hypothetical protein
MIDVAGDTEGTVIKLTVIKVVKGIVSRLVGVPEIHGFSVDLTVSLPNAILPALAPLFAVKQVILVPGVAAPGCPAGPTQPSLRG